MSAPTRQQFVSWFESLSVEQRVEVWWECEALTAAEVRERLQQVETERDELARKVTELDGRRREGRRIIHKLLAKPDDAEWRAKVADYLNRTHDPKDVLR